MVHYEEIQCDIEIYLHFHDFYSRRSYNFIDTL